MARIAGRNAVIYMSATNGAAASPLAYQASWAINFGTNKIDVTAFGDTGKTTVSGLPEQTGQFAGFYDDASAQTYTAAVDGLSRAWYLYPSRLTAGTYFFGSINPDLNIDGSVADAVKVSASWAAASPIAKVG